MGKINDRIFSKVNSWVKSHLKEDGTLDTDTFPPKWGDAEFKMLEKVKNWWVLEKQWEKENPLTLQELAAILAKKTSKRELYETRKPIMYAWIKEKLLEESIKDKN